MATKQSSSDGKHTFASLLLVVVLFGSLAVLALVPIDIFQAVRAREQLQIVNWLGQETDQWIMDKIFEVLTWMNTEAGQLMEASAASGVQKIDSWLVQRVYAATVWGHVILYRLGMIFMWTAFALPCMFAAFVDGHYQRQIAKASFSSQSPLMHKYGMDLGKLVLAVLVAWLFVPMYVSTLIAPLAIVAFSIAWWLWVANLQKRL